MSLEEYKRKRNFEKTAEPPPSKPKKGEHRFVIQKHEATRLHYDFRLELDGTLKSWAVPKGPPFEHGEKRMAVHVEDHPVSYIDFEGTIPKGQYGGGTVMVWDRGTFEPLSKAPLKDLANGKLHFVLKGEKLNGEWYLVRLREEENWLLIKGGESMKPVSKKADDTSVVSGKTMKQLAAGDRVWNSKPATAKKTVSTAISDLPQPRSSKWGQAITASEMKKCHWVEPVMAAQVKFSEWTSDHHLRQPVYLGLREDKDAAEVIREKPTA